MKVGIIGCGAMAHKRARALVGTGDELAVVYDYHFHRANEFALQYKARACSSTSVLYEHCDAVIVATTHDALAEFALQAMIAGKHVLVEKPGARSADELEYVIRKSRDFPKPIVRVGYNHRFHPAALLMHRLLASYASEERLYVRAHYGHGGRVGYEKEWRCDASKSGGGELIDQGVHLVDLARWMLGCEFPDVQGRIETYYWDTSVEDNAFLTLASESRQVAHLHASWTEWRNSFRFEVTTKTDQLIWEGLGGSYGPERLTHHEMTAAMGPPKTTILEYRHPDESWRLEWHDFRGAITCRPEDRFAYAHGATLDDALAALRLVDTVYQRSV